MANFSEFNGNFSNLITNNRPILLKEGDLARGSGPEVYLIEGNQRRWIPDSETFTAMRLDWNAIQDISDGDINDIPLGQPLPTVSPPPPPTNTYQLPYPDGVPYMVNAGNDGHHQAPDIAFWNQYAWDFDMEEGDEVVATRGGTVISFYEGSQTNIDPNYYPLPPDWYKYTNYVVIDHGDGTSSLYAHLNFNSVVPNVGDQVIQNKFIAQSGNTGYSTGRHLHYSVQKTPAGTDYGNGSGGYWTESLPSSFTDPDVLRQNPDGVPTTGNSYTS